MDARCQDEHRDLLDHLARIIFDDENSNRSALLEQSRATTHLTEYMRLTHEVLAALVWYKRFAQSVLDVDASAASAEEFEPA